MITSDPSVPRTGGAATNPRARFRIADHMVAIDPPHPLIEPLFIDQLAQPELTTDDGAEKILFDGTGWVAGRWHHVRCSSRSGDFLIDVDSIASFSVERSGAGFALVGAEPGIDPGTIACTALGPPLVFTLARAGRYCLHAGAVSNSRRTVAFIGPSGAGKSTLARLLHEHPDSQWQRACDDILATRITEAGIEVLPHFPQLKMAAAEQPWYNFGARLGLDAIYALEPAPPAASPRSQRLGLRDAAVTLLSRTVAARLFSPAMKDEHLGFCTSAASEVPVFRLTCPHRHDIAADVIRLLDQDLRM